MCSLWGVELVIGALFVPVYWYVSIFHTVVGQVYLQGSLSGNQGKEDVKMTGSHTGHSTARLDELLHIFKCFPFILATVCLVYETKLFGCQVIQLLG